MPVFSVIYSFLLVCTVTFGTLSRVKPTKLSKELLLRTKSWWTITIGVTILILAPALVGTIILAYVSFLALREMFSISDLRAADRPALWLAYFAIPVQFYLAFKGHLMGFLGFMPLIMFVLLAMILVFTGKTKAIGRSMALIPMMLLLTVFMPSHLALFYGLPFENEMGTGGILFFLIIITAFNDVFQFAWGKMLGRRKIIPSISPNKTWEGFIGGVLTTGLLGYGIALLVPVTALQALLIALTLGIVGFAGDILISAIKRDLEIKDTGKSIPGHGGILDRMDSLLLTAPAYFYLMYFFTNV